jgi:hypothetical protein
MKFLWLLANGTALTLLVIILGGWARCQPRVREIVPAIYGAAVLLFLFVLFTPSQVPTGWITVLMEGRGIRNIDQLYGRGAHFGTGYDMLIDSLTGHDARSLPGIVRFNLCLTAANAIIFFLIARHVLGSWVASGAFALLYVVNLNTVHVALSEGAGALGASHFWCGAVAGAVIDDPRVSRRLRVCALFLLALVVGLAGLVRNEWLLVGGPAVALAATRVFGCEAAVQRAAAAGGGLVRSVVSGPLLLFVLASLALLAVQCLPWMGHLSYAIAALAPLNVSFVLLPMKLAVFLPIGVIVLFILGVVHGARRWLASLLLPISSLILFKLYDSATRGIFEGFRYLTFLTPIVFFLALFGFRELSGWAKRWEWPWWWRRPAVLLLAMTLSVWQVSGPAESFGRRHKVIGMVTPSLLLSRNQQTEVRYLLDLTARYPDCVFLTKTVVSGHEGDERTGYRWTLFGLPLRSTRDLPAPVDDPGQSARRLVPDAPCLLFYRGLDCNLVGFDDCDSEARGRSPLEERVFENLPYSDPRDYGVHRPEIHLAVYAIARAEPRSREEEDGARAGFS